MLLQVARVPLPDVDDAEDVPAGDDDAADVHEIQDASQLLGVVRVGVRFRGKDPGSDASAVKDVFEDDEKEERDDLQEDGGTEQALPDFDVGRGGVGVGDSCTAVAREGTDDGVQADESGYDASRVDGTEVGNIVQSATEDDIVGQSIHWGSDKKEDSAGDEQREIVGVKGGDLAQGETGDEEQAAPGEGAGDFP